jgi:translation initiation factor IF-2
MANIRIYELARVLNLKNKDLLAKIAEMNIDVGSHMSSLDVETEARVKKYVLGKKETAIEETRVRPTVVRRRRKLVSEETAVEEETASVPEAAPEKEAVEEVAEVEATAPVPEEPPVAELPVKKKKPEKAKIIRRAKPKEPVIEEKEVVADESAPLPEPPEELVESESDLEAVTPEPVTTPEKEAEAPETDPEISKAETAELLKKKGKKKAKKDTPAKIIKLGEALPPQKERPPVTPRRPSAQKEAIQAVSDKPEPKPAGEEKRKKKKGRTVEVEATTDRKFLKKKIAFRKKAVVEGKDLYAKGARGRKGRKGMKAKGLAPGQKTQITVAKAIKRRIKIDDAIVLSDLAKRMGVKASEIIMNLMGLGVMATVNQTIDFETAVLVAAEFEYEVERAAFEEDILLKVETDDPGNLVERAPVVTIMGHVDHGKTSLLDVIRKTSVTSTEAGGITQHIGAYNVSTERGKIAFLDTPGHEAFTAMRARGAQVTDVVILVVAADDGVMPQTIEAINHSKAANVPIIVAVNKMDRPSADPERVMRQIADAGLAPEEWGGDTIFLKVSAKEKQGIDELLEMISLQAELMELKANPTKFARGCVVEARLDSGRGPVATVLVQEGTLRAGDSVVCGVHYGKVRALVNDRGTQVELAGPSTPVEILGLSGVPNAGDEMVVLEDDKNAKQVSAHRLQKQRARELAKTSRMNLESLFEQMQEGEVKDLNIILKADVHGSIEALSDSLVKLSNEEVKINIVHSATGTITESDVSLATVSNAIIIGFNVRPNSKVQSLANEENVDMRFYNIIYTVIKDVQDAIVGMMASTFEENVLGAAEVRQVFHVPKIGTIAGCYVTDGLIQRGKHARLVRDGIVCYDGKMGSLRRFKDDVKEVQSGYECGIGIENYNDIKVGDVIECYLVKEIKPTYE